MTSVAEKALKQLYDEYVRTGVCDWKDISTPAGKHLASIGLVTENLFGEFKLTDFGIAYMSN